MKKPLRSAVCSALAALSAFAVPVSAIAQGGHSSHHGAAVATPAAAELAEGTVRKIDRAAGRITIAHGPIAALEMPPMTMMFRATDPAMLDQVKVGDRIRFAAAEQDGALVVTKLEAVP
jgi:Cu/Ag efflux protein CusF